MRNDISSFKDMLARSHETLDTWDVIYHRGYGQKRAIANQLYWVELFNVIIPDCIVMEVKSKKARLQLPSGKNDVDIIPPNKDLVAFNLIGDSITFFQEDKQGQIWANTSYVRHGQLIPERIGLVFKQEQKRNNIPKDHIVISNDMKTLRSYTNADEWLNQYWQELTSTLTTNLSDADNNKTSSDNNNNNNNNSYKNIIADISKRIDGGRFCLGCNQNIPVNNDIVTNS